MRALAHGQWLKAAIRSSAARSPLVLRPYRDACGPSIPLTIPIDSISRGGRRSIGQAATL
jgi:hypothetical protein